MAWVSLIMMVVVVFCFGYTGFMPWDVGTFFSYYTMLLLAPITYTFWKVTKRTKFIKPLEADLVWVRPSVDAYEASLEYEAPGFWLECLQMLGVGKTKHKHAV